MTFVIVKHLSYIYCWFASQAQAINDFSEFDIGVNKIKKIVNKIK